MFKKITAFAIMAAIAVPAIAVPLAKESPAPTALHRALKPWDILLPPQRYQRTTGPINVVFYRDPRDACRHAEGMITLACTMGRAPNPVVTIMPEPFDFIDESFARSMTTAIAVDLAEGTTEATQALWRESCEPKYSRQVYARLACHEIIGHQLGRWPGTHPEH